MLFGKYFNRNFQYIAKKGYKMTKLHISQSSSTGTPSGIKVCIFGGNSNIANSIGGILVNRGCPTVFVHRDPLEPIMPHGFDAHTTKNNPYYTMANPVLIPLANNTVYKLA
jgi:hypothetical protein